MNWPVPQDFNEAVQSPGLAFSDPDLKSGQVVVGAHGLPLPRSGNFADVYQVRGADGRNWAIKCFTRPVVGLDDRYKKIGEHLGKLKLPVTVDFLYLHEGVRVRGKWFPAVKMEWVEGLLLNQFVRENAAKPHVLEALFQMWVRLCRRLRDAGIAHADLQHGNVLLVPGTKTGSLGLKLIDYDGMYIPALANHPSGELGHANYQHPDRAAKQTFSPDLDRFPHLVIATALKALAERGPALWDKYDTGENLLFSEPDFLAPSQSTLMQELLHAKDPAVLSLVGRLAVACRRPIPQTPWLDMIAPDGVVLPTSATESRDVLAAFDLGAVPAPPPLAVPQPGTRPFMGTRMAAPPGPVVEYSNEPEPELHFAPVATETVAPGARPDPHAKLKYAIAAMAAMLLLIVGGIIYRFNTAQSPSRHEVARSEPSTPPPGVTEPSAVSLPPAAVTDPEAFLAPAPREVFPDLPEPLLAIAPAPRIVEPLAPLPPDPPPPPMAKRLPLPDQAALLRAAASVREVFKAEYPKRAPAERKDLAKRLLDLAEKTNDDPPGRFTMLQDARDFAIEGLDPALAMQAVEALVRYYEFDSTEQRLQTLEKLATAPLTTTVQRSVVEQAFAASDATLDLDDYDTALKMTQIAAAAARKANSAPGVDEADLRLTQIRRLQQEFIEVKSALGRVAATPEDAAANLAVGRYRCLVQGRWDAGLPFLARGSDPGLKAAAQAELEPPGVEPNNLKIANLWWTASQSLAEPDRRYAESRARHWYRSALAGLTGLTQLTAASRLNFTFAGVEYEPGLIADFTQFPPTMTVGKKGRIDPTVDFNGQEFAEGKFKGRNRSTNFTLQWKGVLVPMNPGRYVLELRTSDPVRLRVNNKLVVDTFFAKPGKKSAVVAYFDRPLNLQIEYQGMNSDAHAIKLFWRPPGARDDELVPADVLFHDKKAAASLIR